MLGTQLWMTKIPAFIELTFKFIRNDTVLGRDIRNDCTEVYNLAFGN